jgi:signal transduction histidine kinase
MAGAASALRRRAAALLGLTLVLVLAVIAVARLDERPEVRGATALQITLARVVEAGVSYPISHTEPHPVAYVALTPAEDAGTVVSLPDNWDGRRPGFAGYVWYRLTLPAALPRWHRPALYLPAAGMNAELWRNGRRVGGLGRMQMPVSRHFYTPQLIELPTELRAEDALWLLLAGHPGYRSGLAPPWLGEHAPLYDAWRARAFWQGQGTAVTIVINMAVAAFVLTLWWRDRSHAPYAWFGAAALVWGLRNLNYVVTEPAVGDLLFAELCVSGAAWFTALFAIFAQRMAESLDSAYRGPRWLPAAALLYAAVATAYFLSSSSYAQANAGFAALAAVGVGFTLWSMWRLLRLALARPEPALVAVAASAVVYLALLLNDYAIGTNQHSLGELFLRQYAALPLFVSVTATLGRRYLQALKQARELAASLQSQVQAQRAQLEASFSQIREVEREHARTQERARLMGDLHDGLGLHLATALRQARTESTSREHLVSSLQDCMDDLRVAIDSLDEQERDPLALLGSLRFRMAPRFEALGLQLKWQVAETLGELPQLDPAGALDLLRIVQEALANALKHSGATEVTMALAAGDGGTRVTVSDNGRGFDVGQAAQGRGMGHMRARAQRLGSVLRWHSGEGGTRLELTMPSGAARGGHEAPVSPASPASPALTAAPASTVPPAAPAAPAPPPQR